MFPDSHRNYCTLFALLALVACTVLFPAESNAAEDPQIIYAVNDYVGVFSDAEVDELTRRLEQHHEATGVQMAVLVVDTTGFEPIEDFSLRIAEEWGGGSADRDDGLLFTLAISDRENRLEVGYGLESVIPDYYAARTLILIRDSLRDEDYAKATHQVIDKVIDATHHLDPDDARSAQYGVTMRKYHKFIYPVVTFLALILGFIAARRTRRRDEGESDVKTIPRGYFAILPAVMLIFGSNPMEWIFLPLFAAFFIATGMVIANFLYETPKTSVFVLLFHAGLSGFMLPLFDFPIYWKPPLESIGENILFLLSLPLMSTGALLLVLIWAKSSSSSSYSRRRRRSYSSSGSSRSSSSSRSRSSGGGGSFGGGGASGSW